jgi:N-acetylglucosaminyldiphosphoundecaprenol N-acetyl-beta-D-mannosaminyltransferase
LNILGVGVDPICLDGAVDRFAGWIDRREPNYVCVTPAHSVMECYRDPELRHIFNRAGMVTPDGMAIVWLLRWHGHARAGRVYGPDLVLAACKRSLVTGWRHFFLGGRPGVADEMAAALTGRFPGLAIVGTLAPPFTDPTPVEVGGMLAQVAAARPDILWVGLGSPKQERFMATNVDRLGVPVLVGVGAAFDFLSGRTRQAPAWVRRSGLEWFYRWMHEPRRLAPRYLRYPQFVALVVAQALGWRRFRVD